MNGLDQWLITYLSIGYIGAITLYYIPETSYLEDHPNKWQWVITMVNKLTKDRAKHCVTPTISPKVSQHSKMRPGDFSHEVFKTSTCRHAWFQVLTLPMHDFWDSGEGM